MAHTLHTMHSTKDQAGQNLRLGSALALVDGTISMAGAYTHNVCIQAQASLYMRNVSTLGCGTAVSANGVNISAGPSGPEAWHTVTTLPLVALGRQQIDSSTVSAWSYSFPAYINGTRSVGGYVAPIRSKAGSYRTTSDQGSRYIAAHTWNEDGGNGVTWQTPGAFLANVAGDGITDDWAALQSALDHNDVVILPKGFYRISKPLVISRPNTALVGIGKTLSFVVPMSAGLGLTDEAAPLLQVRNRSCVPAPQYQQCQPCQQCRLLG